MQKRAQSFSSLSFAPGRADEFRHERREVPARSESPSVENSGTPGGELLSLCREVAGAVLARRMTSEDPVVTRAAIRSGLVATVECSERQADRVIDLSLEVIHLSAYGRYRRDALEMALLVDAALGRETERGVN